MSNYRVSYRKYKTGLTTCHHKHATSGVILHDFAAEQIEVKMAVVFNVASTVE